MPEPTSTPTSSMGHQLLGAVAGAAIALGVYFGYRSIAPHLTAYLSIPQVPGPSAASGDIRIAHIENADAQERLATRARAIAERYAVRRITDTDTDEKEPVGITAYPQRLKGIASLSSRASSSGVSSVSVVSQVVAPSSSSSIAPAPIPKKPVAAVKAPPKLPSSGVGVWLAVIFAFLFSIGFVFRKSLDTELHFSAVSMLRACNRLKKKAR